MHNNHNRILVTGGAGFLGSHLCDRLIEAGQEVVCLDNFYTGSRKNIAHLTECSRFKLIEHDVCDPISIDVDEVYHLACPASPIHYQRHPVQTIRTCVQGTMNMLDLCRDTGARLLLASTSEVYGDPTIHPQLEGYWGNVNPVGLRACYDEGKRCAEALVTSYMRQFQIQARIARLFNTYGPRLGIDDGRVVSNFIIQALAGNPLTICGNGMQTRSFCFVDDLIEGLIRLMASDMCEPVNLGNPAEVRIADLASEVIRLVSSTSAITHLPLPSDDPVRRRPDISKAIDCLGWNPTISLEAGLIATIDYFRHEIAGTKAHRGND